MPDALTFDATEAELAVFLAETDELLQALETGIVGLEHGEVAPALHDEIFRLAHTIKGSAAAIGHAEMVRLAHGLEDLLDHLRSGRLRVSPRVADVLLLGLDALRVHAEEVRTRRRIGTNVEELLRAIDETIGPLRDGGRRGVDGPDAVSASAARDAPLVSVRLILAESTPLPAARALLALSELDQIGEVQWCAPTRTELEREAVERTLEVHLATPVSPEQIRQMFRDASDYASVTVMTDVAPTDGPPRDPAPAEPSVPSIVPDRPALSGWAAGGEMASSQRASPTVRIDVAQLDLLMNLVGELAIDRGRLRDIIRRAETAADMPDLLDQLVATALHLERVTGELQAEIMKSRMLPISHVFSRFPRLVRDLSRRFDKEVDLVVEGVYTELDRSVIEEVGDPLIHLLRNAIDHGIESPGDREAIGKPRRGTIRLSARHEADQVVIEVSDDGRGIDGKRILRSAREKGLIGPETAAHLDPSEALDLIFLPGLSTAKEISDVSGRGVGLDVVRANLEKLHGSVGLSTTIGRGTTFSLRLPLTLAIVSVLLVVVGPAWYALPVTSVVETLRVEPRATHRLNHHLLVDFRGSALPLVPLAALLGEGGDPLSADSDVERLAGQSLAVIVQHGARRVGLIVDRLVAEQEVVIKPLDPLFGDVDGVAGVAILGDGRVAPILYVPGLIDDLLQAGLSAPAERAASVDAPIRSGSPKGRVRA